MRKSHLFKIFVVLNLLIIFCTKTSFACEGSIPPVCEAFAQARNVFSGKLIKMENGETDCCSVTIAHFEVTKIHKGKINNNHIVKYSNSDCGIIFVPGESYLVYETRDVMWAYDRILPLNSSKKDIQYIESLSTENRQYMIFGQLQTYLDEKLKGVRIFVEEGEKKYEVGLDKDHYFTFKTIKPGKYRLKIIVPFDAEFSPGNYSIVYTPKVTSSSEQTIAETEFEFRTNDCNYVEYFISRKKDN